MPQAKHGSAIDKMELLLTGSDVGDSESVMLRKKARETGCAHDFIHRKL